MSPSRTTPFVMVFAAAACTVGFSFCRPDPDQRGGEPAVPAKPIEPAAGQTRKAITDDLLARGALMQPAPADTAAMTLGGLCDWALATYGLTVRVDFTTIARLRPLPEDRVDVVYDTKLRTRSGRGMTLGDVLADAAALFNSDDDRSEDLANAYTFRVRGGQVVMVPAFRTVGGVPATPFTGGGFGGLGGGGFGGGVAGGPADRGVRLEQLAGPPVSVAVDGQTLTAAVLHLRRASGANIVVDPRCRKQADAIVAGAFDDVRLLTVLQVLADTAGLVPVTMNNVFYLTAPASAAVLQRKADFSRAGEPTPDVPPGYLTDGTNLFPRTADQKPLGRAEADELRGVPPPAETPEKK